MPADPAALAPTPIAAWSRALGLTTAAGDADAVRSLAALVGDELRITTPDLAIDPGAARPADLLVAVARFGAQFVVDVSGVDAELRDAAMASLGAAAFPTVQALYVLDLGTRVNVAFRSLFDTTVPTGVAEPGADLWSTLEDFMRAVALLDAVDPVTTEVVRLRGARAHNCRLCQSLRNVTAVRSGAGEDLVAALDGNVDELSPRHRLALRLVDTMVWSPGAWPDDLAAALRAEFSESQLVELVLDVARNSANKIAVAFGADDPHVTEGVEYYDVDPNGDLAYGLTL